MSRVLFVRPKISESKYLKGYVWMAFFAKAKKWSTYFDSKKWNCELMTNPLDSDYLTLGWIWAPSLRWMQLKAVEREASDTLL